MSLNGFYQVSFGAALPGAGGVVVLKDGEITGGDDQYLYSGTYSANGNRLTTQITVAAYVAGAKSVFGNSADKFVLRLDGEYHQDGFSLVGSSPFGGQGIGAIGKKLNTLDLNG
ncbi:GrlR family regulatory protein [Microvirgula aerodenitrificans]|uniref:GrlR family regulatory protein n=1 Tax=Microvirgula aerodenitrificans TaxID=57480 RepID=UPI0028E1D808|nr:GrlR family regulatory protein [Microvirgula aerodenitrificans]